MARKTETSILEQRIVVYNDRHGQIRPYTTAYTQEQINNAVRCCVERYGNTCRVISDNEAKRICN